MRRNLLHTLVLGGMLLGTTAPVATAEPGVPHCAGVGEPRAVVTEPRTFEAAAFDQRGRLLLTDWLGNRIDVLDTPESAPRALAPVHAPGGLAPLPDGDVLVGSGIAAPALLAPAVGTAELVRLDPETGATTPYASGLSMGNGVVRGPDGTVWASNDLAPAVDRIDPDGTVHRGWYRETAANGLAVSADGATLFANVSIGDTRVLAIDTATGAARVHFRPPAAFSEGFLDDLDIDAAGRLYAPLYFAGHVFRIEPDGSFCSLASGITLPAGISRGAAGAGFAPGSVYVTTHAGQVLEIPDAVPADGR